MSLAAELDTRAQEHCGSSYRAYVRVVEGWSQFHDGLHHFRRFSVAPQKTTIIVHVTYCNCNMVAQLLSLLETPAVVKRQTAGSG